MNSSQRVFVNTMAQYLRTIINMVLSLYTIRVVLMALGQSDFGTYSLVAGVVAMLSFVTSSLVITTQRFVSYYQGCGTLEEVRKVFNNSLVIHILLGVGVFIVLEAVAPFLFDGFLNIPSERIPAASFVFQMVLLMLLLSIVTSPFRALLISHENIVYISIIDVVDGILKVILATILLHVNYDKLAFYGIMMAAVQLFNFFALSLYCFWHYSECCLPNVRMLSRHYVRELLSFAGWSVYATGCVIGRTQGTAIILNRFMGTVVNAAYGVAFQISSYTNFLSASLANAITPQIVKAEGSGDRKRALHLSNITCKFMFFLLSAIGIPYIFEIDGILNWWLDDVPENASLFCIMVMCISLVDSLTIGLTYINQAIGRIGLFSVVINTPKLLTLIPVFFCLYLGFGLYAVATVFVVIELLCSIMRLPFIHRTAGLDVLSFLRQVTLMEVAPVCICALACYFMTHYVQLPYRFVVTFAVSIPLYAMSVYSLGLTSYERTVIRNICHQISSRMTNPLRGHLSFFK